mmetsp:Transcript_124791/g.349570  ORF Transcript_124791/g.349570 Transcript_124791/m.349570 type:complete len:213 (-) Transcript_124791:361-999(-)
MRLRTPSRHCGASAAPSGTTQAWRAPRAGGAPQRPCETQDSLNPLPQAPSMNAIAETYVTPTAASCPSARSSCAWTTSSIQVRKTPRCAPPTPPTSRCGAWSVRSSRRRPPPSPGRRRCPTLSRGAPAPRELLRSAARTPAHRLLLPPQRRERSPWLHRGSWPIRSLPCTTQIFLCGVSCRMLFRRRPPPAHLPHRRQRRCLPLRSATRSQN